MWLSADKLSMLGGRLVAGLPKTLSGCGRRAKKEGWASREVKGSGGPGGMRTEYRPPEDVVVQIQAFLDANPDFFKQRHGKAFTRIPAQDGTSHDKHLVRQVAAKYGSDHDREVAMAGFIAGSEPQSGLSIDEGMLNACHNACRSVYGDSFDGLSAVVQFCYAVDLYNLLVKMSAQNGGLDKMKCLESNGMVELLNVFIRLGWARKFPPPPNQVGCFF